MAILQAGFFGFFAGAAAGFVFVIIVLGGSSMNIRADMNPPVGTGGAYGVLVVLFAFGGTLMGFVLGAVWRLFKHFAK